MGGGGWWVVVGRGWLVFGVVVVWVVVVAEWGHGSQAQLRWQRCARRLRAGCRWGDVGEWE